MKEKILEELNKSKLLMIYDTKNTLNENLKSNNILINEQTTKQLINLIFGQTGKGVSLQTLKALPNYTKLSKVLNNQKIYGAAGYKNVDELIDAMVNAKGAAATQLSSTVAKGMLKTGTATGELRIALTKKAADIGIKRHGYANKTAKQIKSELTRKGYEKSIADEISLRVVAQSKNLPTTAVDEALKNGGKVTESIKKLNWPKFKKWAIGSGLTIGAGYLLYSMFSDNNDATLDDTSGNEPIDTQWAPCISKLIQNKQGNVISTSDGSTVVEVKNQEYPGGVYFYDNGKIYDVSKKVWGTWKCKGGQVVSENFLNEQVDPSLSSDVDKMIKLLDFPVSQQDLKDAYGLLKKYADSGRGKEFLDLYRDAGFGFGSDLKTTMKLIYTQKAESVAYKKAIVSLISQIESGSGTPTTGDESPSTGNPFDDVEITWGGGTPDDGKKGGRQTYRNCNDFPFTFGCRNEIIKKVQKCLGMEERYQTGNFGPITLNKLRTARGEIKITKEVYDSIMQNCGESSTDKQSSTDSVSKSTDDIGVEMIDASNLNF